jgi:excisionase family DNA binding protein
MQLLSIPEVAVKYNVSIRSIQQAIKKGKLPAIRVGKQYRIDPSNTGSFIQQVGGSAIPETKEEVGK